MNLVMATPEQEPKINKPEGASEIEQWRHQEDVVIPEEIEKAGVQAVQSVPSSLQDDQGNVVVQGSYTSPPVTIPDEPENIKALAKGDPENAQVWNGHFFLRVIAKAKMFGRKLLIVKPSNA